MENSILHRKERLIITAIEIIDDLGIQGLSTREIARRQNISEGTLFRHFKSKNDLLVAVLDHFSKFDSDIYESTRFKNLGPRDTITYLINSYVEYYENYPSLTAIIQVYDVFHCVPELANKINSIVDNRAGFIKLMIEDAQKAGEIRQDVNAENLTYIITGFFREICLKWRLEGRNFSLRGRILTTLKMVLNTFSQANK